ncbi:PREDICTED: LOW QUALITY PROTEIN: cytokine receptor-like [Rhagoletis zephyria]|uniref:LOW QUALITY PROTEIN: cytokine receptor-like n=1 Tax=Rhagoletis zephyria TaxID=28612 RepID=UPI00081169FB|nr:PREDICTED: LOW QUALITY PROTEIN: cytokine receptor-like [Rhagoletis zephyria]
MLQKTEQSLKTTHKSYNCIGWRVLMLGFCVILLYSTVAAASVEATTMGIATATTAAYMTAMSETTTLKPKNDVIRRSIRVGKYGNATILCKTSNRSQTYFYDASMEKFVFPFDIENELLSNYAVLVLNGVHQPSTYLCFQNGTLLSETILTIDSVIQTVVIEMGKGDDAALTCKHDEDQPVYFQKDLGKENIRTDIVSINRTTSILLIKNASLQKTKYSCTYLDNKHIDESELNVGTPPTPVINFICENHNYFSMFCEFSIPPNHLLPDYSLTYQVDLLNSEKCDLKYTMKNGILTANTTLDPYHPSGYVYKFTLIASNILGNLSQEFVVLNNESAIPPKLFINIENIKSHSVNLNWWDFQSPYYQLDLVYDIHVQPVDRDGYTNSSTCRTLECEMILENLPYANWNYTLTVRARVNATKSKWNEPTYLNFKTISCIPDRPPKTIAGGFYIHYNSTEKVISLYWEELARHEQNGPGFYYRIDTWNGTHVTSKTSTETSVTFSWLDQPKLYEVRAVNDVGASIAMSTISVNVSQTSYVPKRIEQLLYSNDTLELLWMHPADYDKDPPSNYTVFWCQQKVRCISQWSAIIRQSSISVREKEFIMAVAANYQNSSSGLHWKTCYDAVFGSLETVTLEAKAVSSTEIALRWRLEETCVNAFNGYNVTYCPVESEGQQCNDSENITINFGDPGIQEITLKGLHTYTFYRITMILYAKDERRGRPSEFIFCRTMDAAPYPPTGLRFEKASLTSNSVNISWVAPKVTNGKITKYTVWYLRKIRGNTTNDPTQTDIPIGDRNVTKFSYKLKDLSSYSPYKVWVTAWTSKQSNRSESLNINTLMGRPSEPLDVDLDRDDGYYTAKWTDPVMPSGLVELYELKFFDGDKVKLAYIQRGSKKTHRCRFKYPGCTGAWHKMEVRAINLVPEDQFDNTTFTVEPKTVQRKRRHSMPTISTGAVFHQSLTNGEKKSNIITPLQQDFECELKDEDIKPKVLTIPGVIPLESAAAGLSRNTYKCPKFPYEILVASLIFVGMFIATVFWVGNDIRRRAKCAVLLPDPIVTLMSKIPGNLTDNQPPMNDSFSKSNDFDSSKNPIQSTNKFDYDSALTPSSSESGVDGVGACDNVSSSSSRDNVDDTYFDRFGPIDALVSSASNTSLNESTLSSRQHSPLQRKNAHSAPTQTS